MDKRRKRLVIWTIIIAPFFLADILLMAYGILSKTWGGIIFIVLMLILSYGDFRIDKKARQAQDGL